MLFYEINPDSIDDLQVLYEILKERTVEESISHKELPTFAEHIEFVRSKPYKAWYIILENKMPIGSCYISMTHQVGVAVFKKYRKQGIGTRILEDLIKKYPNTELIANINPKNDKSIKMFEKLGFKHIQNTYIL